MLKKPPSYQKGKEREYQKKKSLRAIVKRSSIYQTSKSEIERSSGTPKMPGRLKAYLVTKISSIYQTTKSEIEKEQRDTKKCLGGSRPIL
jgi:hypothetical protein